MFDGKTRGMGMKGSTGMTGDLPGNGSWITGRSGKIGLIGLIGVGVPRPPVLPEEPEEPEEVGGNVQTPPALSVELGTPTTPGKAPVTDPPEPDPALPCVLR